MEYFKEKIRKEGKALNDSILKVDSFINHQVDSKLMEQIGEEFANYFKDKDITKVATIESSGIAPAIMTANKLGKDLVIMKKRTPNTLDNNIYKTQVFSFTKGEEYTLVMSKNYLQEGDKVLIIDDFLANGEAVSGALRIIKEAKAEVVGVGILIEKAFQKGRKVLDDLGLDVYSLARIKSLGKGKIEFLGE